MQYICTMQLVSDYYLPQYIVSIEGATALRLNNISNGPEVSEEDFSYYLAASSVYSSKIEGNTLDINSFHRLKENPGSKKKEVQEVEDLIAAYQFARIEKLTKPSFLNAHKILSSTLVDVPEQGILRTVQVAVYDSVSGRPAYLAVEGEHVEEEMDKLFADIALLLDKNMAVDEVFYYAAMLHLWVAMIHPFTDGNGRMARLTEKWFLAAKLGTIAWTINSEKLYWDNRPEYYQNIALGFNYYALKWERCLPFLLMLPKAIS
jgi:Fic family protein